VWERDQQRDDDDDDDEAAATSTLLFSFACVLGALMTREVLSIELPVRRCDDDAWQRSGTPRGLRQLECIITSHAHAVAGRRLEWGARQHARFQRCTFGDVFGAMVVRKFFCRFSAREAECSSSEHIIPPLASRPIGE
jgi:hypothetical protein